MKFWNQQRLTTQVASSFLFLSLIAVGVVGGVTFVQARRALKQAAFERLSVAATLKQEQITRWFGHQQQDFLLTTQFPDVQANLKKLLSNYASVESSGSRQEFQEAYTILSEYLQNVIALKPNFQEILILDRSNRIILSTNKNHEGQYEIAANFTYFEQVAPDDSFAPIFYVSPTSGKPAVTFAAPLRDRTGNRQGVILAHLNLQRIDHIIRERTGLGESGETYLVGSLVTKNTFISKERVDPQARREGVSSHGIDSAMMGISGWGLYRNYDEVPVLGVYRWLNDQDLALLVEMSQDEAFAPARRLAWTTVGVGLVSSGALLAGVYCLSRQLALSRQQLENYSHQLEIKAQEADTANHAKSQFLANMSHELRTPLNAILGFAQLMERDPTLSPHQRESLATINRSGEHLLNLINDVLEMSKIEAGRTVLKPAPFDLHRLLQTLQEMFQMRAQAKPLSLHFALAPDLPQCVVGDEGKLRQVLINLLGNAIKFTDTGYVILRAKSLPAIQDEEHHPSRQRLYFEVEDTGRGIAPQEMGQLFEPFVQTASGTQTEGGTGLGLAISRQFVRLMGGEICLSSKVGEGSTFAFHIEVSLAQSSDVQTPSRRRVVKVAPDQPPWRILVVDDRPENRDLLAQLLTTVGFQTQTARDGTEAIACFFSWQPHLIWMDMRMSGMDGYEATRQIKAHPQGKDTVIIALTAIAFEEQQSKILAAGCDDLVRKPFPEQVIFEKLAQHLGVEYLYEDAPSANTPPHIQRSPLTPQDLSVMPDEWVAALHQAAVQVDAELIEQLIAQIPDPHRALANELAELTHCYNFDEIINLTQS